MTLETAVDWGCPPWTVTGEKLTEWRRFVWRARRNLYTREKLGKQLREREEMEARFKND